MAVGSPKRVESDRQATNAPPEDTVAAPVDSGLTHAVQCIIEACVERFLRAFGFPS